MSSTPTKIAVGFSALSIYIFEVVGGKNGPELKVLDTIEAVKAPDAGCSL